MKDQKWLKFHRKGVTYQFRVWPFGLGPVPRWFTKLMKPEMGLLRRMGIPNVIYIDDLWGGEQVQHVHLRPDNTTTMSQILRMGSTKSKSLFQITADLWEYCLNCNITLTVEHLHGALNIQADHESRVFRDSSNWKLNKTIFQAITKISCGESRSRPVRRSNQCTASELHILESRPNSSRDSSTFPLFCLINRYLTKVQQDQTQMIIITHMWQGHPWYASLLQMSTADSILLPNLPHLLTSPTGDYHPLVQAGTMTLAAWKVSGRMPEKQHYQQQVNPCWRHNCPMGLGKLTKPLEDVV